MSAEQYASWSPQQVEAYALDKVQAGNWPQAGALERSRQEMLELLPRGVDTPGHRIFNIVNVENQVVGDLWIKLPGPAEEAVFIYNIKVHSDQRGRGYGHAALKKLELRLKEEGAQQLSLHVFGFNQDAQRLYQRLGFEVTNISMSKFLGRSDQARKLKR